jgi:hypothetical protein
MTWSRYQDLVTKLTTKHTLVVMLECMDCKVCCDYGRRIDATYR